MLGHVREVVADEDGVSDGQGVETFEAGRKVVAGVDWDAAVWMYRLPEAASWSRSFPVRLPFSTGRSPVDALDRNENCFS